MLKPNFRLISVLLFWAAMTSPGALAGIPGVRFEMSGDALFISVGSHKTYRRYYHYVSTPEGIQALLNSFVTGFLTFFVDCHVACEACNRFSKPLTRLAVFVSVQMLLPPLIRNTVSWQRQQRLQQEQIRVNHELVDDLFYIEMLYGLEPDQQALEIRPIPESLTRHPLSPPDNSPGYSLSLWEELYQALQSNLISSVRLSWYDHGESRGILVTLQPVNQRNPSYHSIEVLSGDSLPVSIESVLHNEWRADALLQHSRSSQPLVSLLKDEVIALVTTIINDPLSTIPSMPLESLVTHLVPDSNAMGFTASLCHRYFPACNTSLQLIWQAFPYPHYRQKLFFDDPGDPGTDRQFLQNTAGQVADINPAEQVVQLFETFLVVVMGLLPGFIFRKSDFEMMVSDLKDTLIHANPALVRSEVGSISPVQWRPILLLMHQQSTPATIQTVCQRLTDHQFDWQALFLDENREASAKRSPSFNDLAEVIQHLPAQEQTALFNSLLASSPADFMKALQRTPMDNVFSWLADVASKQNSDGESISVHFDNLDNQQLGKFVNALLDKYGVSQEWILVSLFEMLPEEGRVMLLAGLARESSVGLLRLLYQILSTSQPEPVVRALARISRRDIDDVLSQMLQYDCWHNTETRRAKLNAFLPLMTVETFKQAYVATKELHGGLRLMENGIRSSFLKRIIRLIRKTRHLGDKAAIEFFSHFNSDPDDFPLVHEMLEQAGKNLPRDSDYRDSLLETVVRPGAISEVELLIATYNTDAYVEYLLKLRDSNLSLVAGRIWEANSYLLADYLAKRLIHSPGLSDDEIQLILNNASSQTPFAKIVARNPTLTGPGHRRHFADFLPETLSYIIRERNNSAIPSLFDWLADLSEAQLKDVIKETVPHISPETMIWWTQALDTLTNSQRIPVNLAARVIANALRNHRYIKPEMLINEMGLLLGAVFTIEISKMNGHSTALLYPLFENMSYKQLAYYLAELTKRPGLWEAHHQEALMATSQLNNWGQLSAVLNFAPDMSRYEAICHWAEKMPQPQPDTDKMTELLKCPVCLDQLKKPTAVHSCGNTFCKQCLTTCVQGSHRCPCCRGWIRRDINFPRNLIVESLIERKPRR